MRSLGLHHDPKQPRAGKDGGPQTRTAQYRPPARISQIGRSYHRARSKAAAEADEFDMASPHREEAATYARSNDAHLQHIDKHRPGKSGIQLLTSAWIDRGLLVCM